ncbi:PepSY-associated TM helix domain-containing protein [Novilysobacter spongiicola]|nr:PepSY-associated TM helix domain-containing protein [Lysobacter spongiicola]MDX1550042.1 PepSY-associated TM helix domain-containing protein [Lysobacter spongiicola]
MPADVTSASSATGSPGANRAWWLKTLHRWHWMSAAASLAALLVFSATGITLNHASQIEAEPRVVNTTDELPASVLRPLAGEHGEAAPLPPSVAEWFSREMDIHAGGRGAEWSEDEVYVSLPRPGGDAWLAIDRTTGEFEYERTDRGWIAWLNDLHKGRNTGTAWRWFIDIFAVACLLFALTGLWLLQLHARQRGKTWPMVALGLAFPALLIILFMH